MNLKQLLGKSGEEIAAEYLENKGYNIIDRNFRCVLGEIDLIVKRKGILTFVEVKTRRKNTFGSPADAITYIKRKHMYKAAEYYILKNKIAKKDITLDVVEIYANSEKDIKIIHLERAIEDKP